MDHGAAEAVDRLLASDYPVTDLLAAAPAAAGADTSECSAAAWELPGRVPPPWRPPPGSGDF